MSFEIPNGGIPVLRNADLVSCSILVNQQEISEEYRIISLEVTKAINTIPAATIFISDGDTASRDFPASSSDLFVPGNEIEIQLGYHSDETGIFKGIIIRHGLKARHNKPSLLKIECKDISWRMTVGRKSRSFSESTDSDIINSIISEYGITSNVEETEEVHEYAAQYDIRDWDFINLRAEVNNLYVFANDGEIEVNNLDFNSPPEFTLSYGSNILDFEADVDAGTQISQLTAQTWSSTDQEIKEIQASGETGVQPGNFSNEELAEISESDNWILRHSGQLSEQELQAWADSLMSRSRMAKNIGIVSVQGIAEILPGHMITLAGLGDRFNGNAIVSAVRHEFSGGSWITHLQYGISFETFAQRFREDLTHTAASGITSPISGLQSGIVLQLQDDPRGEERILVKMPSVSGNDEGVWARIMFPGAGDNRGIVFRPEIGDEVIIGFLNEDPRHAVILGMIHSSAKPSPLQASDDNHEKGIFTRGEMKLKFDDDKKILEISTPSGNIIKLDEDSCEILIEDENGNKIQMDSSGITLESAADLVIKASGDIKLEGVNIEGSASANFNMQASAGLKAESSGITEIKGSMVKIN